MTEVSLRLGGWETDSPAVQGLEEVINASRTMETPDQILWHDEAIERSGELEPQRLSEAGVQLLEDIPYDQIIEAVSDVPEGTLETLNRVRMGRKLFLVARDAIIVGTDIFQTSDYEYLRITCKKLGLLADANGADSELAQAIITSITLLKTTSSHALEHVRTLAETKQKVVDLLHTSLLVDPEILQNADSETYHRWRKDFRRVANSYALVAGQTDDKELRNFASQGVILNTLYGNTNDTLDISTEK